MLDARPRGRDPRFGHMPTQTAPRHWDRARAGACVVVGGRTAVWAPVPGSRAVVVVDEGDEALEDERAPTWNARDVAVERARRVGAARARPHARADRRTRSVAVGAPVGRRGAAGRRVEVVDQRDEEPGQGLLSTAFADALRHAVGRGARAVCVLNRRGRARLLACGRAASWPGANGAARRSSNATTGSSCPRCDTARPGVPPLPRQRRSAPCGPGDHTVRDDLAALLPRVEVASVDAATDAVPDVPVLVGTEAVLHRVGRGQVGASPPTALSIGLVAFLELDQELLAPRARAAEQALWLLVRGARLLDGPPGAAARADPAARPRGGAARRADGDPMVVAGAERTRRAALGFPPFGGLAEVSGAPEAVAAGVRGGGHRRRHRARPGRRRVPGARARPERRSRCATPWPRPAVEAARTRGRLRIDVDPRRV